MPADTQQRRIARRFRQILIEHEPNHPWVRFWERDGQMVRCKFRCSLVRAPFSGSEAREVTQHALYEDPNPVPEDQRFADATPSGEFRAVINNPAAIRMFEEGKSYYIDVHSAE